MHWFEYTLLAVVGASGVLYYFRPQPAAPGQAASDATDATKLAPQELAESDASESLDSECTGDDEDAAIHSNVAEHAGEHSSSAR